MQPFKLERYFAMYEFSTKYLLCVSDCEALAMGDVVAMADAECQALWSRPQARIHRECSCSPPEEGIYLSMRALLQPSDHVVCVTPGYQSLYEIGCTPSIGCDVTPWNVREIKDHPNHAQEFNIDELEALLRPNTKLVVINFPHNPTGLTLTRAQLDRIVALCQARGAYLFSDEMYRYLEHDASTRLAASVRAIRSSDQPLWHEQVLRHARTPRRLDRYQG
ncbi:hypothetical protein PINS_up015868 [Pythium insidiosum]|nr:hypothetical protein PINS_up015868 [Pythium insidiosum]